jgi:nitrogen fixation/metabolism regulation signal transduction histidine kinase
VTVAFLLVALLPAVPLSLVVRNLLERSLAPALDTDLEAALEAGLEETRATLQRRRVAIDAWAARLTAVPVLADSLGAAAAGDSAAGSAAASMPRLVILDAADHPLTAEAREAALARWPELAESEQDEVPRRIGPWLARTFVGADGRLARLALALPAGTVSRAGRLTEGIGLLRTLRRERGRVLVSFVGPFLVVYGLLILVALAAGGLLARRLVRPLEALVAGTRRVASGDLRTPVEADGPGEVGDLVRSFNAMLSRLELQRRELGRLERIAAWRGMARTLAHEVKNPLTPILLAVQEVRDGYGGEDTEYRALLDECLEIVREEVEHLRALVRDFGDFARLPQPEPQAGDLAALLAELGRLYGDQARIVAPPTAPAWFDAAALRRVLVNLVDNGLAACREASRPERVEIALELDDALVRLRVADRGVGIPRELRERIFEPDFTTKGQGGMGLGLAICTSIVAGHGGSLAVAGAPGEGTVMTVELPRTPPPGGGVVAADSEGAAAAAPDQENVR